MQPSNQRENTAGLDGPDYVALVIEWNVADVDEGLDLLAAPVDREASPEPERRTSTTRTIAAVVGALGALMLAAWGLRRLRAV